MSKSSIAVNDILKEHIKNRYPESTLLHNGTITLPIDNKAKISLDLKNTIRLEFEKPEGLELSHISSFYKVIIPNNFGYCIMLDKVTAYKNKFEIGSPELNAFRTAMETFDCFENLRKQYLKFCKILNGN